MSGFKILCISLLMLLVCGCATAYVPVSWGMGERVQRLSRSDVTLSMLFDRYDPQRETLRVRGDSFEQVMMPDEVKFHLGAYVPETKLIYRNLYKEYSDEELRDLMLHELAHHVWFSAMSPRKRAQWSEHLHYHPSPLQLMVRRIYPVPASWEAEDFAFTVEYARSVDINALANLDLISAPEREAMLADLSAKTAKRHPKEGVQQTAAAPPSASTARLSAGKAAVGP